MNVSDYLLQRMARWGVRYVYGYPGDGINGIMGAFNRDGHGLRFIQARHEETAAFMACAQLNSAARSAFAWPLPGPAPFTC